MIQPSQLSLTRCALTAGAVWLIFFYFARHIAYGGDDSVVLVPLFGGGLAESLGRFLRPLEYLIALWSAQVDAPLWLSVSALAYVAMCMTTLSLLCLVNGNAKPPLWQIVVCAVTPLAAQPYFQIDTVSQALANAFSLGYLLVSLRAMHSGSPDELRRHCWRMAALALLCILSKETTYGIVFLGALLILFRHRTRAALPAACIVGLLVAAVLWRVVYQYGDVAVDSGFGFKLNPLYWVFSFVFSVVVAASPLPTAITLSGAYASHPALLAVMAVGLAVVGIGLLAYRRSPALIWQAVRQSNLLDLGNVYLLLGLYLLASVVPTVFFKAAELYASQLLPLLKVLLLSIPVASPVLARVFWSAYSALWMLASIINIMYYSVATGYDPQGRTLYAPISAAVASAPRIYSIYHRGIYADDTYPDTAGSCMLSRRSPGICLPRDISSGYPKPR